MSEANTDRGGSEMKNVIEELNDGTPYVSMLNYFGLPHETRQFLNQSPSWRFDFDRMVFLKTGNAVSAETLTQVEDMLTEDPVFEHVPTMEVAFGRG